MELSATLLPVFALVASLVSSCRNQDINTSTTNAIIGTDDRKELGASVYDSLVGLFMTPRGSCTAFVSGPQEITTAAHCFKKEDPSDAYLFSLNDGRLETKITAVRHIDGDIVVLQTDRSFLSYLKTGRLDPTQNLKLVSFDQDKQTLNRQDSCSIQQGPVAGSFLHDCDTAKGSSGSPLIQNETVVGIHLGYSRRIGWNIAQEILSPVIIDEVELKNALDASMEIDCGTNCYRHCRRRVLGRWVPNPPCETACQALRVVACNPPSTEVKVCGVGFSVSAGLYLACQAATASIPPACTGAAAVSAGSSCAVSVGTASGVCGVSINTLKVAAVACIASSLGVSPNDIKLPW